MQALDVGLAVLACNHCLSRDFEYPSGQPILQRREEMRLVTATTVRRDYQNRLVTIQRVEARFYYGIDQQAASMSRTPRLVRPRMGVHVRLETTTLATLSQNVYLERATLDGLYSFYCTHSRKFTPRER